MLHIILKPFRIIHPHSDSYSFAALVQKTRDRPTKFSHTRISCSHMLKNPRGHDEDSGGVNLTPRNLLKPQSSKAISAPALSSSDCKKFQEPIIHKTPMKLSVQPVRLLSVPELLVKFDGIYRATLWLCNLRPSHRLHN